LPLAAHHVGKSLESALAIGRTLADAVLRAAWDVDRGGVIEAGPVAEPFVVNGTSLRIEARSWWVQTEALKILLELAVVDDHERYRPLFERSLDFVDREFVDRRHGGWYAVARSDQRFRLSPHGALGARKGDAWKDASHEADFYLTATRMLRGLTATEAF
jgi:mannose/cellobiose epimerase-like protein (N-acyl-D-glucosamine 2-epimerase family)